jgi:hypothetical protein
VTFHLHNLTFGVAMLPEKLNMNMSNSEVECRQKKLQ